MRNFKDSHLTRNGWILAVLMIASANADAIRVPLPAVTSDLRIDVSTDVDATVIDSKNRVTLSQTLSAQRNCDIPGEKLRRWIADFHSDRGSSIQAVFQKTLGTAQVIPDSAASVQIIIHDFSGRLQTLYKSLYFRKNKSPDEHFIYLDCKNALLSDWNPTLTHELYHLWAADRGLPSWLEEGMAQFLEESAGSVLPKRRANSLSFKELSQSQWIDDSRPITSASTYKLSYLFVKYVDSFWGGLATLRAMNGLAFQSHCTSSPSPFDQIMCRGQDALPFSMKLRDRFFPESILRFFSIALILNHPRYSVYSIPEFNGPRGLLLDSDESADRGKGYAIAITSSSLATLAETPLEKRGATETYRVLSWKSGFKILQRGDPLFKRPLKEILEHFKIDVPVSDFGIVLKLPFRWTPAPVGAE